jgi:hypothetical protein
MNGPSERSEAASLTTEVREKRQYLRRKVIWSARITSSIGERQCAVLNISRGGAQVRLDATLDPCSTVEITIPGLGKFRGWVAWSHHDRAGLAFAELSEAMAASLDQALRGRRDGSF